MCGWTVVFDLDGTLVDTAPDLIATLNALLAAKGLSPVAPGRLRSLIGGGLDASSSSRWPKSGLRLPPRTWISSMPTTSRTIPRILPTVLAPSRG